MKSPYVGKVIEIDGKRYIELVDHCEWVAGDSIGFSHKLNSYELAKVSGDSGITIMADHSSTGIWDYQTRYMLEYSDVPELDQDDIDLIKMYLKIYETWPWDSVDEAEIQASQHGYQLGLILKHKHPELNIYFYNYNNGVKGPPESELPLVFDGRVKIELKEI